MDSERTDRRRQWLGSHWVIGLLLLWLALSIFALVARFPDIAALGLHDTDDNLRLVQVRDWLAGQSWFDLRQYRMAPPVGANIHWSRLVDLPIAFFIVVLKPLLGTQWAEQSAVALAPLVPFGIGLTGIALVARRLIDPLAWPVGVLVAICSTLLLPMWMPLRIDHHGWQLALLAVGWAGLCDPQIRRGGIVTGVTTALSLAIGLEMLAFLALIGAATAAMWLRDGRDERIASYGAALAGGTALSFAVFASNVNRGPVCDALSPVWLSAMVAAGALLVLLALLPTPTLKRRLAGAAAAGALLAIGFALAWPDCLGRPEGVSPELQRLWLDNVREAKPITAQGWRETLAILALPLSGLAGYVIALRRFRDTPAHMAWLASAGIALAAVLMLFWQVRVSPAAQLLAIPGGVMIAWLLVPRWRTSQIMLVRVFGTVAALALATGLYAAVPLLLFHEPAVAEEAADASASCMAREMLEPLDALAPGTILAPVDLGPRLLVLTPHSVIAGPYHRNGQAIVDIFRAFRGAADDARSVVARRHVDYVLICDGLSGDVYYRGDNPESLFARLETGDAPGWLVPVPLPAGSPLSLWRVR